MAVLVAATGWLWLSEGASAGTKVEISGVVRDQETLAPIPDALVSLQASGFRTTTWLDGTYTLLIPDETDSVIVAAKKGYFNRSVLYVGVPDGLDIDLEFVPQHDDPSYMLVPPQGCGGCHPDQLQQWNDSRMQRAGLNTWVHDIYNGDGTPGGKGGFVYTRDSMFAEPNPNSECASCHQPESWIAEPFSRIEGPSDSGYPSDAAVHGVSCDVCHKLAHVDEEKINYPGLFPGAVEFTRPAGPEYHQVQYGLLGDSNFSVPELMRASYQPQLAAAVCGTCHQDKNDPHEDHTFDGVISEPTYIEWLESPYGDVESPKYADCLSCHMLPSGADQACDILFPPLKRDPATLRSHTILGTTPEYLENAAELGMYAAAKGGVLEVDVDVINSQTGHHVPTGVTVRNMILLVEVWRESDGVVLEHTGEQVVHELGGVGDPAEGYYAGLPGKFFGKVNHDRGGNGPTFFTDAFGIQFDSRIPALETDSTSYTFAIPEGGGDLHVRARLIYRRAFRFLVDAKRWTETGHGEPLADVQPPHYGHLMEMTEIALPACGAADLNGDLVVGVADLIELITAWGACGDCPQDLDGDGVVGVADLVDLIVQWGPCYQ
jgi:hypothetical protein